jgi:hypothetical protein
MMFRVLAVWLAAAICLASAPLGVCPSNPHYFCMDGKPILLITSAEHYGAVINSEFNYVAYLDALRAAGLNYTRIYPGYLFEPVGKYLTGNTLGPRPRSLILPWARSDKPGYMMGGNLFDLDRWDARYFARLKDFVSTAAARGIVVEVCFFNSQYSDTWPISPLYSENNIQSEGGDDWRDAQSLKDARLVAREEAYVRRIAQEVNGFDNVILEVCDEPASIGTGVALAGPWVAHMADVLLATEKSLAKKHLIAQEVEGPAGGAMDFSNDPRISVIVGQYIYGGEGNERGGEMGGLRGLDTRWGANKPIELNETGYYPLHYRGDKIADSRVEAWEFMVGGGAGFNQLNGLFTVENPAGRSPDNERLFQALAGLRAFLTGFDFVRMKPDRSFVKEGPAKGVYWRALAEPGRQYALYLHHSGERRTGSYEVAPGDYRENLAVELPAGKYRVEWVEPATGTVLASSTVETAGEVRKMASPRFAVDLALRIQRAD